MVLRVDLKQVKTWNTGSPSYKNQKTSWQKRTLKRFKSPSWYQFWVFLMVLRVDLNQVKIWKNRGIPEGWRRSRWKSQANRWTINHSWSWSLSLWLYCLSGTFNPFVSFVSSFLSGGFLIFIWRASCISGSHLVQINPQNHQKTQNGYQEGLLSVLAVNFMQVKTWKNKGSPEGWRLSWWIVQAYR